MNVLVDSSENYDGVSVSVVCFLLGGITGPPNPLANRPFKSFRDYLCVELGTAHVYDEDYQTRTGKINEFVGAVLRGLVEMGIDRPWVDHNNARIEVYFSLHPGPESAAFRIHPEILVHAAAVGAEFRLDYI